MFKLFLLQANLFSLTQQKSVWELRGGRLHLQVLLTRITARISDRRSGMKGNGWGGGGGEGWGAGKQVGDNSFDFQKV